MTAHAVRSAASRFVDRLDVGPAPIDTIAVAKTLGLPITREPLATDITGALVTTPRGFALVLNARQPANRQRLLVAHMIGHLQLGHRFQSPVHVEGRFEAYRGERRYTALERLEDQANVYAGSRRCRRACFARLRRWSRTSRWQTTTSSAWRRSSASACKG